LSNAQNNLAQSVMRLSSGLRINNAKDDAAGLAISQDMQSQINGTNQSIRNLNDATNMMQVADTSLATIHEMLLRMKQLSVQGYNGSLNSQQRTDLVDELQQLNAEINNTASRTKYNGNVLIANESGYSSGTGFGSAVYSTLAAARTAGKVFGTSAGTNSLDNAWISQISTSGAAVGTYTFSQGTTTSHLALSLGASGKSQEITVAAMASGDTQVLNFDQLGIQVTIKAGGTTVATETVADFVTTSSTLVVTGSNPTNQFQAGPDVSSYITYQSINTKTDGTTGVDSRMTAIGTRLTSGNLFTYAANSRLGTDTAGPSWDAAFNSMVSEIDNAIQFISERRSVIGAQINRISYIQTNLESQSTNLQSSRSTMMDTDFAAETARLTKGQIMQQAATAMLAQANQMPNVVLSLLK
jgi:flagellin